MKLAREGAARLGRHESRGFPLGDFEFQPEDFDGNFQNGKDHVVLTIDQAKELALKLKNNAEFFFLQTGEFDYDTDELWQCLTEKIEQAEKCYGSHQKTSF